MLVDVNGLDKDPNGSALLTRKIASNSYKEKVPHFTRSSKQATLL